MNPYYRFLFWMYFHLIGDFLGVAITLDALGRYFFIDEQPSHIQMLLIILLYLDYLKRKVGRS